ncbi:preprotein translocase subunit SecY [Eubacteriales bacterium OttesenSCG-928-M02]|nr:preprotein translocase subunit SecY [Eubacteriales bacterium OttesenSCG-928-M02]
MLETVRNAWRIKEIRMKILYTLFMLFLYRLGTSFIPVAGVNAAYIAQQVEQYQILGFLNMITGGSLGKFTIFALGISPYITASIVLNLLTFAIPALERLAKEGGDEGKEKIQRYTRYLAMVLALVESIGITYSLRAALLDTSLFSYAIIAIQLVAGTALTMWMCEKITEKGIGNGVSLIIFVGIVAQLPSYVVSMITNIIGGNLNGWVLLPVTIIFVGIVAGVVYIDNAERRITVQYAKRVVGRKMYGGQSTHIPLKLNSSGVLPIIFAMTLLQFPLMISQFWPQARFSLWYQGFMSSAGVPYNLLFGLLILAFSYFYTSISFNPIEISKNIQQYGGFIPGIRPGRPTSDYLARISGRLTFFGGCFLAILATVPTIVAGFFGVSLAMQATGILISVSVALETTKSLESQMLMRHYSGFLK